MSNEWVGSIVSVDCGDVLGVFVGEISHVDGINQTISLINVSRNSVKCQVPEITLSTLDIKSLALLQSTLSKDKEGSRDTVKSAFTKPPTTSNGFASHSPSCEDNQKKKGENKKKTKRADTKKFKDKNEDCFNAPLDNNLDFDFEKNLALFDKQAVFSEIDALSKSDRLRLVDFNKSGPKYRHDENVLNSDIPILKQISLPCRTDKEFVTDSGLIVPSVTLEFKNLLFKRAEELGMRLETRIEMIGRSACEMVLHLVGGSHRMNPQNTHQRPTVVILCGANLQGVQGVNCGRQLANHCVNVTVLCPNPAKSTPSLLSTELNLFRLTTEAIVHSVSDLPSSADMIIDALETYEESAKDDRAWTCSTRQWLSVRKSHILYLDPPPHCDAAASGSLILTPALPFAFTNAKCSIHICDVGMPRGVYSSVGCQYSSPFGSKFVVPLYTAAGSAF